MSDDASYSAEEFADPAPRFSRPTVRSLILAGLWLIYMAWVTWDSVQTGAILMHISSDQASRYPFLADQVANSFALNLWALVAGGITAFIVANPFAWLNGKRLVFGSMAFGMMLGRAAGGRAIGLLTYLPIAPKPALVFVLMPFVLLVAGLIAVISLGLLALTLFSCFVAIPAMLFNQILTFENAVHVYRYQAQGLSGYIVRAVYWLRNEERPVAPPDESKGARFATMPEISRAHKPNAPQSMAFGHMGMRLR